MSTQRCFICHKPQQKVTRHIRCLHLKVFEFYCNECGKGFWSERDLKSHKNSRMHYTGNKDKELKYVTPSSPEYDAHMKLVQKMMDEGVPYIGYTACTNCKCLFLKYNKHNVDSCLDCGHSLHSHTAVLYK
jgi:hypothetical protein